MSINIWNSSMVFFFPSPLLHFDKRRFSSKLGQSPVDALFFMQYNSYKSPAIP